MMAFAACCHAAFETASQIRLTDPIEGSDHLLLCSIHRCHLAIRRHCRLFMWRGLLSRIFQEMRSLIVADDVAEDCHQSGVGNPEPYANAEIRQSQKIAGQAVPRVNQPYAGTRKWVEQLRCLCQSLPVRWTRQRSSPI
jgi:hypothetical protein